MAGWPLPPTHSKVVHAVAAALYNRFNTPLTSIKQEHLETLHKSSICLLPQNNNFARQAMTSQWCWGGVHCIF